MIDKELLDILACPLCKTEVKLEDDKIYMSLALPTLCVEEI